jgi:hypothetical protein
MKKYFVYFMAIVMLISTLMASMARADLFSREPKKANETVCAFVGGVLGAVIGHQVADRNLVTVLAGVLGAVIGHNVCSELNDIEKRTFIGLLDETSGAPAHAPQSLDLNPIDNDYYGILRVEQLGERRHDRARCLLTSAGIYQRRFQQRKTPGQDPFMGGTRKFWLCKNAESGKWEVDDSRFSRIEIVRVVRSSNPDSGSGGAGGSGPVYSRSQIESWTPVDFEKYFKSTSGDVLLRSELRDRIYLTNRLGEKVPFAGLVRNQDGILIVKGSNKDMGWLENGLNGSRVGVECDALFRSTMNRPFCESAEVVNLQYQGKRINGTVKYIFKSQEVLIDDSVNGDVIVPLSVLTR